MRSENIERIRNLIGERTDDDALALLEIINDPSEQDDWEKRYNDLDESWRKRYRDTFENRDLIRTIRQEEKKEDDEMKEEERLKSLNLRNLGFK